MLIFKLFTFFFYTLPLILASLYLLVAVYSISLHSRRIMKKAKIPSSHLIFTLLNCVYIVFFSNHIGIFLHGMGNRFRFHWSADNFNLIHLVKIR